MVKKTLYIHYWNEIPHIFYNLYVSVYIVYTFRNKGTKAVSGMVPFQK